jgi:hypothetical protein
VYLDILVIKARKATKEQLALRATKALLELKVTKEQLVRKATKALLELKVTKAIKALQAYKGCLVTLVLVVILV